jgi:hypothetical protein
MRAGVEMRGWRWCEWDMCIDGVNDLVVVVEYLLTALKGMRDDVIDRIPGGGGEDHRIRVQE